MKKQLLLILCAFLLAPVVRSQELIKGGNMEDPTAWNVYWNTFNAVDTGVYEFNYTTDVPAAGEGGCYRVSAAGQAANMLWQPVKLLPGHRYMLTGAYKYIADTAVNVWVEYMITRVKPYGRDTLASGEISTALGYSLNTWMAPDIVNFDGTFEDDFRLANIQSTVIQIPDTTTQIEWYVALKAGCWNAAGDVTPVYDLLFDELSLVDLSQGELVKGGNMEDPTAWNAYWNTFNAVDTGVYEFNYTADGPAAGEGGSYRVTAAGQAANMLWQPVTILPGHKYSLTGAYKYLADTAVNVWVELFITRIKPYGRDTLASGEISTATGYSLNTWMAPDNVNFDGTFQEGFAYAGGASGVIQIPDTVTQTEWYLAFKAGCWNAAGDVTPVFDLAIDEISLIDLSLVSEGGNMEDPSKWNVYWNTFNAVDTGIYEFNYTADAPAAGEGGNYRVTAAGQAANMLWQPVTIVPGHQYKLEGAYKYIADTAVNVWVEYFLTRVKPYGRDTLASGEISTGMGWSLNTWMSPDNVNFDGTFQDDFALANIPKPVFLIPDTVTQTEWYLAMKAGCWNAAGDIAPVFDLLFDEIYMYDLGTPQVLVLPIANIVVGSVDDAADYTGQVTMSWDSDSLYMVYDVVDDIIVNTGASYQVDNIEIYFDMDNSKNIHYPRNGGWMQAIDAAYDTNDYQLRLVPDVAFVTNNSPRPASASLDETTVNQVYTSTADGYQFVLNVAWDALLEGFEPEAGTLIGFDVLLSDNDVSASDANRNQITWNSPTDKPFNDPSLFGVLKFVGSGSGYFEPIPDKEKPTAPATVTATLNGADAVITWDASTDNRVVQHYIVYNKTTVLDTILAKQADNTYTVAGLVSGSYTFGVVAMDVYGNKSAKTSAAVIEVGIEELTDFGMLVYPNPSNGLFNITSESNNVVSFEVYNLTGGLVAASVFTQNYTLDLSKFSRGVYFLHLNAEGKKLTTKLIVQ